MEAEGGSAGEPGYTGGAVLTRSNVALVAARRPACTASLATVTKESTPPAAASSSDR